MNDYKQNINKGFSKISKHYEDLDKTSDLINWMRSRIRKNLEKKLLPGEKILEINAGSGIDAVYFASLGYDVLATDIADGMLSFIDKKSKQKEIRNFLRYKKVDNNNLKALYPERFHHIFSNFGGLNCSSPDELENIFKQFPDLLYSGGTLTLVIMPKICPWEWLRFFKNKDLAFRRLSKKPVLANIEGVKVRTYYYNVKDVKKLLANDFKDFSVENISFFGPTGNRYFFKQKHPVLFKILTSLDKPTSKIPFLQGIGDYFVISAVKK